MKIISRKKTIGLLSAAVLFCTLAALVLVPPAYEPISFPEGKKFAFTICDDTDMATVENIKPVYDYLQELGLRITKTVWVLPTNDPAEWPNRGQTLSDSAYRAFVLDLRDKGFEIALHGARGGNSQRSEILESLKLFKEIIGYYPRIHINHYRNKDNLYWGVDRLSFWPLRLLYEWTGDEEMYYGHVPGTKYFWGDIAREHISYVVNFSFFEINITKVNPLIPYYDPATPYVNNWFHTSDGASVDAFNRLLCKENLDQLEREGGVCIVYTHLAYGFYKDGVLHSSTKERLKDLASRDGWFVPASDILDYLRQYHAGRQSLSLRQKVYLEVRWVIEKIVFGRS